MAASPIVCPVCRMHKPLFRVLWRVIERTGYTSWIARTLCGTCKTQTKGNWKNPL